MGEREFIDKESLDKGIGIKYLKLKANNPNEKYDDPQQSAISYEILNADSVSIDLSLTGFVENYWNILKHNTRARFFTSLFIFPWPTVKFPIEENKNWN